MTFLENYNNFCKEILSEAAIPRASGERSKKTWATTKNLPITKEVEKYVNEYSFKDRNGDEIKDLNLSVDAGWIKSDGSVDITFAVSIPDKRGLDYHSDDPDYNFSKETIEGFKRYIEEKLGDRFIETYGTNAIWFVVKATAEEADSILKHKRNPAKGSGEIKRKCETFVKDIRAFCSKYETHVRDRRLEVNEHWVQFSKFPDEVYQHFSEGEDVEVVFAISGVYEDAEKQNELFDIIAKLTSDKPKVLENYGKISFNIFQEKQ